jgi:dCTP diphosphatase
MEAPVTHDSLATLRDGVRQFAHERDWEQFHTPKNLSCALAVEASEILEHFQWVEATQKKDDLAEEIGDVLIYLVRLADVLGIDPVKAAEQKLAKNALKYPVDRARGSAKKYNEL